jgi:7,8-dihydropterin-6-yl-methyl-4-(beta-D-ribofuranosyl)aminobenzene 5'-phosphate synthase
VTLGKCRAVLLLLVLSLTGLCLAHQAVPLDLPGVGSAETAPVATHPSEPSLATPEPSPVKETPLPTSPGTISVTIVYDNRPFNPSLSTAWGFSCLVRTATNTVLFDTGGDGAILMANMAALQIEPGQIDTVVLSHNHRDHTGGLQALLAANDRLTIFAPQAFAEEVRRVSGDRVRVIAVTEPVEVVDGVWALGEMGTSVVEQALAVETSRGLVVITGCAHPGLPTIVRRARTLGEVDMLIGGFHLQDASLDTIQGVIGEIQSLGVRRAAPCHCTGESAIREFQEAFGPNFQEAGVGARYEFESQ